MNDQLELNDSLQYFDKLCQLWSDSTFLFAEHILKQWINDLFEIKEYLVLRLLNNKNTCFEILIILN